jgi:hypothetical protein
MQNLLAHGPKSCDLSNYLFFFFLKNKIWVRSSLAHGGKYHVLSFVFTYFFSFMIHGDSICWNEKYEESEEGEEMVGMWWKKRKDKL